MMLSSGGRGLLEGTTELVWYIGFCWVGNDGDGLRAPFSITIIDCCWGLAKTC